MLQHLNIRYAMDMHLGTGLLSVPVTRPRACGTNFCAWSQSSFPLQLGVLPCIAEGSWYGLPGSARVVPIFLSAYNMDFAVPNTSSICPVPDSSLWKERGMGYYPAGETWYQLVKSPKLVCACGLS